MLTSIMSGGKRSFSISLFLASSKPWIASLIPSAPELSCPGGKALFPAKLLSSDTFSDSSLGGCQLSFS